MSPSPTRFVRRLTRNAQGELEEAGLVADEAPAADDGFVGDRPAAAMNPNGSPAPRFRAYRPQATPPPPSAQYRADPGYVTHIDISGDTRRRAITNHRAWSDRHAAATNQTSAWLGHQGLLGPELAAAYAADNRADQVRAQARQAVAAAQAVEVRAEQGLTAAVAAWLESDKGPMPSGDSLVAARAAVEAVELVAAEVEVACSRAGQRLGQARGRIDWSTALTRTSSVQGPDAEQATAWLRAKISPPPGPGEDPLGWI